METIIGFILGIIASFLVWYLVYHIIVPKIEFFPNIYKQRSNENHSGFRYVAKIKNVGKRDIIDVEIFIKLRIKGLYHKQSLWKGIYIPVDDERIPKIKSQKDDTKRTAVQMCLSKIKAISTKSFPDEVKEKLNNETLLLEDLLRLGNERELQIFVFGYDPYSGSRKMFESKVYGMNDIEEENI
jgi:hypothetical protein